MLVLIASEHSELTLQIIVRIAEPILWKNVQNAAKLWMEVHKDASARLKFRNKIRPLADLLFICYIGYRT